jgi:hypothetical protein
MTYVAKETGRFFSVGPAQHIRCRPMSGLATGQPGPPSSANRPFPTSSKTVVAVQRDNRVRTVWIFIHDRRVDQAPLRLRIRDLAQARARYGYFRIYILLRREG